MEAVNKTFIKLWYDPFSNNEMHIVIGMSEMPIMYRYKHCLLSTSEYLFL